MYRISFQNSSGEIDAKNVAGGEPELKQAILDMVESTAFFCDGDKIVVQEVA